MAFRAEFPTNHELIDTSADATSPRSPPKRKFNEGSQDSSAEDGSQPRWVGMTAPPYKTDGVPAAARHELSNAGEQYIAPWSDKDNHPEANQQEQDLVMEKDGQESGADTPQPSNVKSVEMEAKTGMPMLVPSLSNSAGGAANTSDGMDVDYLPAQALDRA
jgi:hypothetical protein